MDLWNQGARLLVSCLSFPNSSPFYSPQTPATCPPTPGKPRTAFLAPCCLSISSSTTEKIPQSLKRFLPQIANFLLQVAGLTAEQKAQAISRAWAGAMAKTAARGGSVRSRCAEKILFPSQMWSRHSLFGNFSISAVSYHVKGWWEELNPTVPLLLLDPSLLLSLISF